MNENEVFDYYYSIFKLDKGERVKSFTPLDCIRSHKMAYVISNYKHYTPAKVFYVPYLHPGFSLYDLPNYCQL